MPGDYVVPNFAGWLVSAAKNHTTNAGVGLRVSTTATPEYHPPDSEEETRTVNENGSNSQPGTTKPAGDWVGINTP